MTKAILEYRKNQLLDKIAKAEKDGKDTTVLYAQLATINKSLEAYQNNE